MDLQKLSNAKLAEACCMALTGLAGCNKDGPAKPNIIPVMADPKFL